MDDFLSKKLNERKAINALRQLHLTTGTVDFCSNDYLGIVKNHLLNRGTEVLQKKTGSTGSRLLAGNYPLIEAVEKELAAFHNADSALIFNSGYDANVGILSSIAQRGDTIIYDALSHASIRDGIRLSFAHSYSFTHNDLNDLEKKLQQAAGNIFVVTESVFSMDGDISPITEIVALCKQYEAHLIIDEAHATGVIGESGEGLVQKLRLENDVFCRIHTFGKALGCYGALVLGSQQLADYLINFARSFIYSTALPEQVVFIIKKSYEVFPVMNKERKHLHELIQCFQLCDIRYEKLASQTPIQVLIVPGNKEVKKLASYLQERNFDVRAILYPTVPKGKERLRIVLHSFNTIKEVNDLVKLLKE
jgi:8-amino-7-oxononanoate synthase